MNHTQSKEQTKLYEMGYLTWNFIPNGDYKRSEVLTALANAGVDTSSLEAKDIRPLDAFKRATRAIEGKRDDHIIRIRDVVTKGNVLEREISIEIPVSKRKVSIQKGVVRFNRMNEELSYDGSAACEPLAEEVKRLYKKALTTYPERVIRSFITDELHKLSPLSIRPSGGVYFIPKQKSEKLKQLISFAQGIPGAEAVTFMVLSDQLVTIEKKLLHHMDQLIEQNTRAQSAPNWQYQKAVQESRQLLRQFHDYRAILGTKETLESKLGELSSSLTALIQNGGM